MADLVEVMEELDGRVQFHIPPDLSDRNQDWLRDHADMNPDGRLARYQRARDAYDGNYNFPLTDRLREYLEHNGVQYSENFAETVADVLTERLEIEAFVTDSEPLNDWLGDWLRSQNWDVLQSIAFHETVLAGDGFLIVDQDPAVNMPRLSFNMPDTVCPCYSKDDPMLIAHAAKQWETSAVSMVNPEGRPVSRLNVYHADMTEKWFTTASDGSDEKALWAPWVDDGDTEWPIPWTRNNQWGGPARGVPVFHLRNKPGARRWGRSELEQVIPQIHGLHKHLLDLHDTLDYHAAPQRWATGVQRTLAADGSTSSTLQAAPGVVWSVEAPDGRFGEFPPVDPSGLLAAIEAAIQRIAGRSRTPMHQLLSMGALPSGESLKTAESGLTSKARDRQPILGVAAKGAVRMAVLLATDFRSRGLPAGAEQAMDTAEAQWRDPVSRNELEFRQQLVVETQLGLSKATALRKLGYDPDSEAEQRRDEAVAQAEVAQTFFDQGDPRVTGAAGEPPNEQGYK